MHKRKIFQCGIFFFSIQFSAHTQVPHDGTTAGSTKVSESVSQEEVEEQEYNEKISKKRDKVKSDIDRDISHWGSLNEDPAYKKFFEELKPEVTKYVEGMEMSREKAHALKGVSTYKHLDTDQIYEEWTQKEAREIMHAKVMDFIRENPREVPDANDFNQVSKADMDLSPEQAKAAVEASMNAGTKGNPDLGFSSRDDDLNRSTDAAVKAGGYENNGQMSVKYGMPVGGIDRSHIDEDRYQGVYNEAYKKRPDAQRSQFDWNFGVLTPQIKDGNWSLYDVRGREVGLPVGLPDGRGGAYTGVMMTQDNYGIEKGWIVDSFGKIYDNDGKIAGTIARGNVALLPRKGREIKMINDQQGKF